MPVFTAGTGFARAIAASLRVPFFGTSHQQGHVRAAMEGAGALPGEFLALHLSGGTTEVLHVRPGLKIALLGGSNDLHAGQLVDRVGVRMGLPFPAGPALEALARQGTAKGCLPASRTAKGRSPFSGAEAQAMRMLEAGVPRETWRQRPTPILPARWPGSSSGAYAKNAPRRGTHLRGRGVLGASARASARAPAKAWLPGAFALGKARNVGRTTPVAWRSSVGRNTSMAMILNGKQGRGRDPRRTEDAGGRPCARTVPSPAWRCCWRATTRLARSTCATKSAPARRSASNRASCSFLKA